jgi:hypothetical protein
VPLRRHGLRWSAALSTSAPVPSAGAGADLVRLGFSSCHIEQTTGFLQTISGCWLRGVDALGRSSRHWPRFRPFRGWRPLSPALSEQGQRVQSGTDDCAGVGRAKRGRDWPSPLDGFVMRANSRGRVRTLPELSTGASSWLEFYLRSESENNGLARSASCVLVILNDGLQKQEMRYLKETVEFETVFCSPRGRARG